MRARSLIPILRSVREGRVLVIGDFMIDEYLVGSVDRISPEAPVPVVREKSRRHVPGGAGNVVRNLRALGVRTSLTGVVGGDADGAELRQTLADLGCAAADMCMPAAAGIPTTKKTRVLAGNHQICRIDLEKVGPPPPEAALEIAAFVRAKVKESDAVIISDYDKGVVTAELIAVTVALCRERKVLVAVDPQVTHFSTYKDVDILTPNHHEAGRFLGRTLVTDDEVRDAGLDIVESLNAAMVLITRGEKGMSLIRRVERSCLHIPTMAREVFDVTGAGDTVISVLTAMLATGATAEDASVISNIAAGLVVGRAGAAVSTIEEIEAEILRDGRP